MERLNVYGRCVNCLELVVLYRRNNASWWLVHLSTHFSFEDDRIQNIGQLCCNFQLRKTGAPDSKFTEFLIGAYEEPSRWGPGSAERLYVEEAQHIYDHDHQISAYFK